MADTPWIVTEVALVESQSPFGSVGDPRMLCRFRAAHLAASGLNQAKASVVVRDGATRTVQNAADRQAAAPTGFAAGTSVLVWAD
jgi:hypothetical protein